MDTKELQELKRKELLIKIKKKLILEQQTEIDDLIERMRCAETDFLACLIELEYIQKEIQRIYAEFNGLDTPTDPDRMQCE